MMLILNRRTLICLQRYNDGKILTKRSNIDIFARYGHLSLIILYNNNTPNVICTPAAMNLASENGHHDIVIWLHENRYEGCTRFAMNCASLHGHHDIVKFLHFNCHESCTSDAIGSALLFGHDDIVNFLKQHYPQ
jgi:hypothetical protein